MKTSLSLFLCARSIYPTARRRSFARVCTHTPAVKDSSSPSFTFPGQFPTSHHKPTYPALHLSSSFRCARSGIDQSVNAIYPFVQHCVSHPALLCVQKIISSKSCSSLWHLAAVAHAISSFSPVDIFFVSIMCYLIRSRISRLYPSAQYAASHLVVLIHALNALFLQSY